MRERERKIQMRERESERDGKSWARIGCTVHCSNTVDMGATVLILATTEHQSGFCYYIIISVPLRVTERQIYEDGMPKTRGILQA